MMVAAEVPLYQSDIDDYYKCPTCSTIFQNLQQLWSVTELVVHCRKRKWVADFQESKLMR